MITFSRIHRRPLVTGVLAVVSLASPLAADCGPGLSGACCTPHTTPGCSDTACCTTVCNQDPFCCDVGWDGYCAAAAVALCGCEPEPIIVAAFGSATTLPGGLAVAPCDLAQYDPTTGAWSIYFDGNDVGLTGKTIQSAARLPDGQLLVALDPGGSIPDLIDGPNGANYTTWDVLRFTPTTLGDTTAGSWTFHLDGSDVGLSGSAARKIQTVSALADGSLIVSVREPISVTGVGTISPRDLIKFTATSYGGVTAGTWTRYFEGGDVELTTYGERLDTAFVLGDGRILMSTLGAFATTAVSGGNSDLFAFTPTALGANTTGTFSIFRLGTDLGIVSPQNMRACFVIPITLPTGPRPGAGGGGGGGGGGGDPEPPTCGDASTGECCVAHTSPFCSDAECCETVCAIDPVCCSVGWDFYCADLASIRCTPCMPERIDVMSFNDAITLPGGIVAKPCDLVSFDVATGTWSVLFDGDDVGIGSRGIAAAAAHPDGGLLITFLSNGTVPGLIGSPTGDTHEGPDILHFIPTSYGEDTAGTWHFYFDGSDVGLTGWDAGILSLGCEPDGSLLINFRNDYSLPPLGTVSGCDLVKFLPTSTGADTAGTWSMYLDGSDVGLTTLNEKPDAAGFEEDSSILLSCRGSFGVSGLSGGPGSVFRFKPTSVGNTTAGTFELHYNTITLGIPNGTNVRCASRMRAVYPVNRRPLVPILFEKMPRQAETLDAIEDEFLNYILVYQGVDPLAAQTGLIDPTLVIAAIREEHGDDPVGYGVLDFESPFIERLEAGPTDPNYAMTVETVVNLLESVKTAFPRVRWTMYGMPLLRYWIQWYWSWSDAPAEVRENAIDASVLAFDPVLRACDWLNPSSYDRYELATYTPAQQANKTAQELAWRTYQVEACKRFNQNSGLPPKPIIPMVSPMFWRVGQIEYNMKWISEEEFLRDQVEPLMEAGADGIAIWSGLEYWIRAATSAQDLGSGQVDCRYAFTRDYFGGTAPASWTDPAVRTDLEALASQRLRTLLDSIRTSAETIVFGNQGP